MVDMKSTSGRPSGPYGNTPQDCTSPYWFLGGTNVRGSMLIHAQFHSYFHSILGRTLEEHIIQAAPVILRV
jgi:hypothetical protein